MRLNGSLYSSDVRHLLDLGYEMERPKDGCKSSVFPLHCQIERACKNFLKEGKGYPKELHLDEKTYALLDQKEFCWRDDKEGSDTEWELKFTIPVKAMPFPEPTAEFIAEVN